ncbi:class D sortase [Psychrobacillus sp. FJAT-51614]|uniref:Class D sortase n=1 Tax=Psychrobacillus mangrovi TaxID=3117745 RepID=A0ABU8F2P3_9BACI
MKKSLGNIMIGLGLVILILVGYGMMEHKRQQNELIQSFTAIKTEAATNDSIDKTIGQAMNSPKQETRENDVVGILKIPEIELEAPVLKGATTDNLNKALGMINGLDDPGTLNGSTAIAGHQSHVFGQFFNRLNELKIGDRFELETSTDTLNFKVFNIQVVKPENVEILMRQEGISLLSLVTCYPERSNQFRLVVQAKKVED